MTTVPQDAMQDAAQGAVQDRAEAPEPFVVRRAGMTLTEAVEALAISERWLEEAGGELTPEVEALLDQAEFDLKEKVERVALKVRWFEGQASAIKEEANRLLHRATARANAAKSLKHYLELRMQIAGLSRVDGLLCTVALQQNPPAVQGVDALTQEDLRELFEAGAPFVTRVPESFRVDRAEVLAAVKRAGNGEVTEAAQDTVLPPTIRVTRSRSLRIR